MSDLEDKIFEQEELAGSFNTLWVNFNKDGPNRKTRGYVVSKTKIMNSDYEDLKANHSLIISLSTTEDRAKLKYFTKNVFSAIRDIYDQFTEKLSDLQFSLDPPPAPLLQNPLPGVNNITIADRNEIRLSPIEIPKFNGSYHKWTTFRNLYKSLVHDSDKYSQLQKFHYLKSFLVDEASRLISQLSITEESYQKAWDILEKRYENTRVLVDTYVDY